MTRRLMAWLLAALLLCAAALAEDGIERGAYIQRENGAAAIYASDGTLLYPAGMYSAWRSGDQLIHIRGENGEGVLDEAGSVIVQPEWDWTIGYSDGRICVFRDKMCGVLDERGNAVTGLDWGYIYGFHNGFAAVSSPEGGRGVIDRDGSVVIEPTWYSVCNYSEDNAFAEGIALMEDENYKIALVSLDGTAITGPKFNYGWGHPGFYDGLGLHRDPETEKFGYFNTAGELVIPPKYDYADDFVDGYARVKLDGVEYVIDTSGEMVGACEDGEIFVMPGGYVAMNRGLYRIEDRRLVLLNDDWDWVMRIETGDGGPVRFLANGDPAGGYGFYLLDGNGVPVNEVPIDGNARIGDFRDGLARVYTAGKYGFIDSDGRFVIPAEYDDALQFWNGRAVLRDDANAFFIADAEGNIAPVEWTPSRVDRDDDPWNLDQDDDLWNIAEYFGCAEGENLEF